MILTTVKFITDPEKNLLFSPVKVAQVSTKPIVIENSSVILYQSNSNELRISGIGLIGSTSIKLYFNPPLARGIAYDIVSSYPLQDNEIVVRLFKGHRWRELVGPLNILGIDSGGGWNTFSGDGVTVAMVVTDDDTNILNEVKVFPSTFKLYQSSNQNEVVIYGYGFKQGMNITLSTNLEYGKDYIIHIKSISKCLLQFNSIKWQYALGPLLIKTIIIDKKTYQIGGDNGIQIAIVMMNPRIVNVWPTSIEVISGTIAVYQSLGNRQITILGNGFKWGMKLELYPNLVVNKDYTLDVYSFYRIILKLKDGKKWSNQPGPLLVTQVILDDKIITLSNGEGLQIAILQDPIILETAKQKLPKYYETQSKVIAISGRGFTSDTIKITLEPTLKSSYEVLRVERDTIYLQLKRNESWLPSWLSFKQDNPQALPIPLLVSAINTGAGKVILKEPITIGYIVRDIDRKYSAEPSFQPTRKKKSERPSKQPTMNPTDSQNSMQPTASPVEFIMPSSLAVSPPTGLRSSNWDNSNVEPLQPPNPLGSIVEESESDMLRIYNFAIQIFGGILILSAVLYMMIVGYEWCTYRSDDTKRLIDSSGHVIVTPAAIYESSNDGTMHSRHSRVKSKHRWYRDDVEIVSHRNTDINNYSAISIALESKLYRLEKQLHEINSYLVLSTMEVILRNKPIFDMEKLKILRLKGQLSWIGRPNNVIVSYEHLDSNTEFAEWNRIATECNTLMDQLHSISPSSPSDQGKENLSSLTCKKSCVGSSKRYLKLIVITSLILCIALMFVRVISFA